MMRPLFPKISDVIVNRVLLFIALATRVLEYTTNRSFWGDEAMLALNIIDRSYGELLQPLDYFQAAPAGFLWITKFVVSIFGDYDYVYRLFPLLMSLIAVWLLYRICERAFPRATSIALLIFATTPLFIYQAAEFKQYSVDMALALLILWIVSQIVESYDRRWLVVYALLGVIAVWLSHPAMFVLAGTGLTLIYDRWKHRDWQTITALVAIAVIQAISFFVIFFSVYQYVATGTDTASYMQDFWQRYFLELSLVSVLRIIYSVLLALSGEGNLLIAILFIFGIINGLRQISGFYIALLFAPTGIAAIASLLDFYPLFIRFLLFMLPSVIILISLGLRDVLNQISRANPRIAGVLALLLFGILGIRTNVAQTQVEARDIFTELATETPHAKVYTMTFIDKIALYYKADTKLLTLKTDVEEPAWILQSEYDTDLFDERPDLKDNVDAVITRPGIRAYCFNDSGDICNLADAS